ncbi:MAG: DedA family protein [Alphaproteobacteria bacterium]|nr:MAG: DedA family protein [Alphaproteobacteria bacterium]
MSETVFALVADWGPWVILASAFLSCFALPIPTSLMMLTGGAFVSAGDLDLWQVVGAAFTGAVLGDQAGYGLGRFGGAALAARLERRPARAAALARARALVDRRGGLGVFLSTWAVAPLGPWVNFIAGATGLGWARFALADILGEVIWVALYVGLGMIFASQVSVVAEVMGDVMGLVAAAVVALGAGLWIGTAMKAQRRARADRAGRAEGAARGT